MKDDYLWDKTGEPDPEIQHLERVMGQLRHRLTVEDLPAFEIPRTQPRIFSKLLAIAAAFAFAALALGAIAALHRQSKNADTNSAPVVMVNLPPSTIESGDAPVKADAPLEQNNQVEPARVSDTKPKATAVVARRRDINRSREALISEREEAEGLMAKEQLIKALVITSNKLDFVQKKVKGDERRGPSS
jgi:hypothetical protein